jgi:hypothetical protein
LSPVPIASETLESNRGGGGYKRKGNRGGGQGRRGNHVPPAVRRFPPHTEVLATGDPKDGSSPLLGESPTSLLYSHLQLFRLHPHVSHLD